MAVLGLLLCLLAAPCCVWAQVQLKESGPGLVKPPETLSLTCSVSGFSLSGYGVNWIRQPPGKGLEWIGVMWGSGSTGYNSIFKSRANITGDSSKSQIFLKLNDLQPDDTGVYFCVRLMLTRSAFDVWGQGIHVTVSSESPKKPDVYPLSLPKAALGSESVTIGCLIQNYFPSEPVSVTWSKSGATINYPPAQAESLYTMSSQLTLPAAECPENTSVTCSVQHYTNPVQTMDVPCLVPDPVPPPICPNCNLRLSLQRPNLEDLLMGSDASLTCTLSGLRNPEGATFTWEPSTGKNAVLKAPVQDSQGWYSVSSVLPGCAEPWNSGTTFKCTVRHPESKEPLTESIAKERENKFPPQVHLLPPPSEELGLNELVSLTCLVRGFSPKDVLVRWLQGNQELPKENYLVFEPMKESSEGPTTYAVTSVLRVSAESWKQGDNFSCMVGHEALPLAFTQKTIDRQSGKPTHVNVSVVMSEADGVCY